MIYKHGNNSAAIIPFLEVQAW